MTDDKAIVAWATEVERILGPFYDRDGNRIGYLDIAAKTEEYRIVGRDQVGPWSVCTDWMLGQDISLGRAEKPLIFETMVFGPSEGPGLELGKAMEVRRYATEAEAIAGHDEVVTLLRATVQSDPQVLFDDTTGAN